MESIEMIYCHHGPKRDFLNGNFTSYQDWNHVFCAQTIERVQEIVAMRNL